MGNTIDTIPAGMHNTARAVQRGAEPGTAVATWTAEQVTDTSDRAAANVNEA